MDFILLFLSFSFFEGKTFAYAAYGQYPMEYYCLKVKSEMRCEKVPVSFFNVTKIM